ncbi:NRDE family protein [Fodinibius salsisoli]|uniref:NRDE family protein n=1 Tax=Fodinibius salsisoli TaxID=2820877 RepID=A0ABT3PNX1_9BACT|nr:NRDE family protein [Fodinibius salsisoli]MCW9707560.1 NRDE family protein [Fodinibius salsisoli]
MCLITFAYQQHPDYKLILVANRDEAYNRPTRGADFWPEHPNILAGKDLKAGGTWMGINQSGHFAAITNYRDPQISKTNPPSRGQLVLNYLTDNTDPITYLQNKAPETDRYMGFNLLVGTPHKMGYYSNQQQNIRNLGPGLYGLSNHLLDTPWPKTKQSKEQLEMLIEQDKISEESLFKLLSDDTEAPEDQLPDTGIPKEVEKKISPVFIKTDEYGTRCSTVLLIDQDNKVSFSERRFKAGTLEIAEKNSFEFSLRESN